jgi:hypothetical protein
MTTRCASRWTLVPGRCSCLAVGSEFGPIKTSVFCANDDEKEARECMRDPYGPDDGIRRECKEFIQEANPYMSISDIAMLCKQINCGPYREGRALIDAAGNIDCRCQSTLIEQTPVGGLNNSCSIITCPDNANPVLGPDGRCSCDFGFDDGPGGGPGGPDPDPSPF